MDIYFETAIKFDNSIIFPSRTNDNLYKYDIEKRQCELYVSLSSQNTTKPLYGTIQIYKDRYYILTPLFSNCVVIYDFVDDVIKKIAIDICLEGDLFFESIVIDDKLFMIPGKYEAVVELDLNTYDLFYHRDIVKDIRQECSLNNIVRHGIVNMGEYIYFVPLKSNILVKMNYVTKKWEIIRSENNEFEFTSLINSENETLYILCANGNIVEFFPNENRWKMIYKNNYISTNEDTEYYDFNYLNENFWLFPRWGNTILCVERVSGQYFEITQGYPIDVICVKLIDNKFYICEKDFRRVLIISIDEKKIVDNFCIEETEESIKIIRSFSEGDGIYKENSIGTLYDFINEIVLTK